MSNASDFIIENGVLTKYVGPGGDVVIPDGVVEIGASAFSPARKLHLSPFVTEWSILANMPSKSVASWSPSVCPTLSKRLEKVRFTIVTR